MTPPGQSKTAADILAIIQGFIDVAAALSGQFEIDELDVLLGSMSGTFGIASGVASDPDTGAPTESVVLSTAEDLASDMVKRQNQILETFDTLNEVAVSDSGRLTAMHHLITNLPWTRDVSDQLSQFLQAAQRQQIATALVTANWTLPASDTLVHSPTWITRPDDTVGHAHLSMVSIRDWDCTESLDTIHPYNQMAPSTEYASVTNFDH